MKIQENIKWRAAIERLELLVFSHSMFNFSWLGYNIKSIVQIFDMKRCQENSEIYLLHRTLRKEDIIMFNIKGLNHNKNGRVSFILHASLISLRTAYFPGIMDSFFKF